MKNLRQQMTTAFGLMLVAMAVAACTPEQAFAKVKGRKSAGGITAALGDGSVKVKRPQTNRKEFDKSYLSLSTTNTYTGTTTVNQGRRNNLHVNAGSGSDTMNVQRRTVQPNRVVGDFNGDGRIDVVQRRNIVGSPEYFGSSSKTKSNLTAGTYGRGSFAKARGQQGR